MVRIKLFDHPINISSSYGWRIHPITKKKNFHPAVDIAVYKAKVKAPKSGIVYRVDNNANSYGGRMLWVIYDDGSGGRFKHLDTFLINKGQRFTEGQYLAITGNTGKSTTGFHLHYEDLRKGTDYKSHRNPSVTIVINKLSTMAVNKYVVQKGDYLYKIARKYDTNIGVLVELNKSKYPTLSSNPSSLSSGWVITVPNGKPEVKITGDVEANKLREEVVRTQRELANVEEQYKQQLLTTKQAAILQIEEEKVRSAKLIKDLQEVSDMKVEKLQAEIEEYQDAEIFDLGIQPATEADKLLYDTVAHSVTQKALIGISSLFNKIESKTLKIIAYGVSGMLLVTLSMILTGIDWVAFVNEYPDYAFVATIMSTYIANSIVNKLKTIGDDLKETAYDIAEVDANNGD